MHRAAGPGRLLYALRLRRNPPAGACPVATGRFGPTGGRATRRLSGLCRFGATGCRALCRFVAGRGAGRRVTVFHMMRLGRQEAGCRGRFSRFAPVRARRGPGIWPGFPVFQLAGLGGVLSECCRSAVGALGASGRLRRACPVRPGVRLRGVRRGRGPGRTLRSGSSAGRTCGGRAAPVWAIQCAHRQPVARCLPRRSCGARRAGLRCYFFNTPPGRKKEFLPAETVFLLTRNSYLCNAFRNPAAPPDRPPGRGCGPGRSDRPDPPRRSANTTGTISSKFF